MIQSKYTQDLMFSCLSLVLVLVGVNFMQCATYRVPQNRVPLSEASSEPVVEDCFESGELTLRDRLKSRYGVGRGLIDDKGVASQE